MVHETLKKARKNTFEMTRKYSCAKNAKTIALACEWEIPVGTLISILKKSHRRNSFDES